MGKLSRRLFSLTGKGALVTGASGGIGRALAIALADAGATVALHGVSEEKLETTRQFVERAGGKGKGLVFPADVRSVRNCRELIRAAHEKLGRLDILVNCVGINRRKSIRQVTEDDFDTITGLNLKSVFF